MNRVLTVGVFDLLHYGHIELFRRAKDLAKIDIANTDVLVLQAHPPYWSSVKDFWNFLLSVLYLKFKGFQFVFPNEVC